MENGNKMAFQWLRTESITQLVAAGFVLCKLQHNVGSIDLKFVAEAFCLAYSGLSLSLSPRRVLRVGNLVNILLPAKAAYLEAIESPS